MLKKKKKIISEFFVNIYLILINLRVYILFYKFTKKIIQENKKNTSIVIIITND